MTFDRSVIEAAGYPLVTPVIILNAKKFGGVEVAAEGEASRGHVLALCRRAAGRVRRVVDVTLRGREPRR